MNTNPHILIVGSGSVGRRHARNLHALGCRISCVDPRPDRIQELASEVPLLEGYTRLSEGLAQHEKLGGVAICSPPVFHVAQCTQAVKAGLPVLLEKPPSVDSESCSELVPYNGRVLLGYTYRWWEPLRRLRELFFCGAVGAPRYAYFVMSAHLADWHPWERYQDFFMSQSGLGGGALLDESHFIDLMIWFFGMPQSVFARIEKISSLEIDTDDLVEISASYSGGLRVYIHLDLFGRPHRKEVALTGEEGSVLCSFDPDQVRIGRGLDWVVEDYELERNDMFMRVDREFLSLVEGRHDKLSCTLEDGFKTLQVVDACRRSQSERREVRVESFGLN